MTQEMPQLFFNSNNGTVEDEENSLSSTSTEIYQPSISGNSEEGTTNSVVEEIDDSASDVSNLYTLSSSDGELEQPEHTIVLSDESTDDTIENSPTRNTDDSVIKIENEDSKNEKLSLPETKSTASKRSFEAMRTETNDEEDQNCSICLDMWTNAGEHRLSSLKCGHLFGKSCILKWLVKQKKRCCPQCNKKANANDVRELFATKLIAIDCSEKVKLENEIEIVKKEKKLVEVELVKCRLFVEQYKKEVARLESELNRLTGKSKRNLFKKKFRFHLEKSFPIRDGNCRVCLYDSSNNILLVCHQNNNQLFPGFGIKRIQDLGTNFLGNNFFYLHSKTIRDMKFHPVKSNILLTVSFDKCAKLCDLEKQSVVQSFTTDYALWSCCWDEEDPNFFYAGSGKGTIYVFDISRPPSPITELKLVGDTSSVVSICYIPSKPSHAGGVLCCRLNSVVFYMKKSSKEFETCRMHSLVGPFFSLIFDSATSHVLVSCRPSVSVSKVRHMFCEWDGDECKLVHLFVGGSSQSMLTRPCFVKIQDETFISVFNENASSIELWSASTGLSVTNFRVGEEILDMTSMSVGGKNIIATVSNSAVRFYEGSDI